MTGYVLAVAFPDESSSFCRGFEAGILWHRMNSGAECEIEETTAFENRELIRRLADYLGWSITTSGSEIDGWDYTKLIKQRPKREQPNPYGLRVVAEDSGP